MKVVMEEPGQYARTAEIGDGLESLQKAVGGLIDCAYPVSYTHLAFGILPRHIGVALL